MRYNVWLLREDGSPSPAGPSRITAQERYFRRYGAAAVLDRIDRVRQWLNLKPYGEI